MADIRERGVGDGRVAEYARAWAASAAPQARVPMPCPACFARGKAGTLSGRSVADGYAAAYCTVCGITFQFSKGGRTAGPAAQAPASVGPTGVTSS